MDDELELSYEPPINAHLRKWALQQAIARSATLNTSLSPQDIVSTARMFYDFLKGDNK